MIKKDFSRLTLRNNAKLMDALNIINEGISNCVFIVSEDFKFQGLVTDGDIRRGLLRGLTVGDSVLEVVNDAPMVDVIGSKYNIRQDELAPGSIVPVVDQDYFLIDFYKIGELIAQTSPVVIMAGGFGTRLGKKTENLPKPMIPIAGKPVLEHIVSSFKKQGFKNFIITTHFKSEKIVDYFKDGREFNVNIDYVCEEVPLGTAGSIGLLKDYGISEPFIVSNGDILCDIDFRKALKIHKDERADVTILTAEYEWQLPYGQVVRNDASEFSHIKEKPNFRFEIMSGNYVFSERIIECIPSEISMGMDELIDQEKNNNARIMSANLGSYWIDIGLPSQLLRAEYAF
jgi:dTDP-glucose pyrophosphorylase